MKFISWASGKKTYITIAVGIAIGVYQGYTGHDISNYIYLGLSLLGIGFARSGATADARAATVAAEALIADLRSQLTVPTLGQPTGSVGPQNEAAVTANLNKDQAAK